MTAQDLVTNLAERHFAQPASPAVEIETPDGKRWQIDKLRTEAGKVLVLVAEVEG